MNYQRIFLKEHYQDIHLLSICVYACDKLPKYKSQIKDIQDTWGKVAKQYHIPVLYFLGEEKTDLSGGEFINLKGVKDDYESASHKQNLGLAYIHDHVPSQFVITVGTDTYLNIPKLVKLVSGLDSSKNHYMGGHGCIRTFGTIDIPFHSGGPGFILTRTSLTKIYPYLFTMMDDWTLFCKKHNREDMIPSCDIAIAYYLSNIDCKKIEIDGFYHCNHKGSPCHKDQVNYQDIVSCHSMSPNDFQEWTYLLETNNYYL